MLLVGLVIGRKWAIAVGGLAWAALVAVSVPIAATDVPLAAALGAANVAVGVFARWVVVWAMRHPRLGGPTLARRYARD
jgi:hypothetical protein